MIGFVRIPIRWWLIILLLDYLPPPGLGKKPCVDPNTGDRAACAGSGVPPAGIPPLGGRADTDCAFALAAEPANNPTLSTIGLSKLTNVGLRYPVAIGPYSGEFCINIPENIAVQQ